MTRSTLGASDTFHEGMATLSTREWWSFKQGKGDPFYEGNVAVSLPTREKVDLFTQENRDTSFEGRVAFF